MPVPRRLLACLFTLLLLAGGGIHAQPRRDLSIDESMGGHTLARHNDRDKAFAIAGGKSFLKPQARRHIW